MHNIFLNKTQVETDNYLIILYEDGSQGQYYLNRRDILSEDWELKQEPRKVTLYQYLYENQDGDKYVSKETSASWEHSFDYCEKYKLLKTFTREIEY